MLKKFQPWQTLGNESMTPLCPKLCDLHSKVPARIHYWIYFVSTRQSESVRLNQISSRIFSILLKYRFFGYAWLLEWVFIVPGLHTVIGPQQRKEQYIKRRHLTFWKPELVFTHCLFFLEFLEVSIIFITKW